LTFAEARIVEAHKKVADISAEGRKDDEEYMEWERDVTHFDGLPDGEDLENKAICDSWDCSIHTDFLCSS
jgi:hypothetical protein